MKYEIFECEKIRYIEREIPVWCVKISYKKKTRIFYYKIGEEDFSDINRFVREMIKKWW